MIITDVENKIDLAIYNLNLASTQIAKAESNFTLYPVEIDFKTDVPDYPGTQFQIDSAIDNLQILRNINRQFKIGDELKNSIFQAYLNGDQNFKLSLTTKYTVSDLDTFQLIESKFGVPWEDIANYNNIDAAELETGLEIDIPFQIEQKMVFNENEIPVFDTPTTEKILGADLPNELAADTNGDLNVLSNRKTIQQGMQNLADTDEGELPFFPDWGFKSWVGDQVPYEARKEWIKQQVVDSFKKDKRIERVPIDEIEVTEISEGYNIKVNLYPVKGQDYITISAQI